MPLSQQKRKTGGGGGGGQLGPSPLFLCDLGLIPDVASSLPAQDTDTPCQHTNPAKDNRVIPRQGVIVLLYLSSTCVALTQCPAWCQVHTAIRLIPFRGWRCDYPHFTEEDAGAQRARIAHPRCRHQRGLRQNAVNISWPTGHASSSVAGWPVLVHHNPWTPFQSQTPGRGRRKPGVSQCKCPCPLWVGPPPSPQGTDCSRNKPGRLHTTNADPAVLNWGRCCPPRGRWVMLEALLVVTGGVMGRGQGCCSASHRARDGPSMPWCPDENPCSRRTWARRGQTTGI